MWTIRGVAHTLRSIVRRRTADAETLEELADHIERQTRKHIAAGMSASEAARIAQIEFGGVQRWREETAEARSGHLLDAFRADVRFALRSLRKRPAFSSIAVLTLALGLGAGSAIFSITDGAMRQPLPFPEPDRLMVVALRMPMHGSRDQVDMVWSYPKFILFRDQQTAFASLALHSPETLSISESEGTERISGEAVSASYFDMLGARPEIGRAFLSSEDLRGEPVVVVSDAFWRTRLGADPHPLTRTIDLAGAKRSIVGVMPPGFRGLSGDAEVWLPLAGARSAAVLAMPDAHNLELIGRLTPGVTPESAERAVALAGSRIDATYPSDDGHWGARAQPLNDFRIAPSARRALALLSAAVVLLMAMVCVNLTTLCLARGLARRGEIALRIAIGASRARVAQQLMTEAMILAIVGGVAGVWIGFAGYGYLASALSSAIPGSERQAQLTRLSFSMVHFGFRTLLLTVGVGIAMGVVIGMATTIGATRHALADALRQSQVAGAKSRGRGALIVSQIGLALLLLVVSGLTVESLQRVLRIPLGYRPAELITVGVTLDQRRVGTETPQSLWAATVGEISRIPGVMSAAVGSCAPIGDHCDGTSVTPAGHGGAMHVSYHEVSAGYFKTLGTPVVRGREFDSSDRVGTERVMVINRAAARTIWGSDDPLTTPAIGPNGSTRVVGVVEDARYENVERPAEPAIFVSSTQTGLRHGFAIVRTAGDPQAYVGSVKQAIQRAGRGDALGSVRTVRSQLSDATARNRLLALIVSSFAIAAMLLAALGVYGSLSLVVAQRSRELAVRRALGAQRRSLAMMVLSQAANLAILGGVLGLILAWFVARSLSALLYDAHPLDPVVYGGAGLLLAVAVAAAAIVPSVRSMRIDPRDAMRSD